MGIDNLLFLCPILRHLYPQPKEGIVKLEKGDGYFGEFIPWEINKDESGGTDMVNWKEIIKECLEWGTIGLCNGHPCCDCIFHASENRCLIAVMKPSERLVSVLRHLDAPNVVTNWQDDAEIRARIAEMLDEETRRKFLGEPKIKYRSWVLVEPFSGYGSDLQAENLQYAIRETGDYGTPTAAFRNKETRDRVLEFLNGEAE